MTTGEAVREARNRAGISIDALARMTGLVPRTIYRVERDESSSRGSLTLIALALGLEHDEFVHDLDGTADPSEPVEVAGPHRTDPGSPRKSQENRNPKALARK